MEKKMKKNKLGPLVALALFGCGTQAQQVAISAEATTLLALASQYNTRVSNLVLAGQTFCGKAVSPSGTLIGNGIVTLLNLSGLAVSVTNAGSDDVKKACAALNLVPGALPVGTDPNSVPTATVNTPLPITKPALG